MSPFKDKAEKEEYGDLELLDRLETLQEDMEELGVTTLAEVIRKIDILNEKLAEKE